MVQSKELKFLIAPPQVSNDRQIDYATDFGSYREGDYTSDELSPVKTRIIAAFKLLNNDPRHRVQYLRGVIVRSVFAFSIKYICRNHGTLS